MNNTLLEVKDFSIAFSGKDVIQQLNFDIQPQEILGIVGESGSGKSLTSLAIMGLLPKNAQVSGSILFKGIDLLKITNKEFQSIRGNTISMIFQEPMTSLNPSKTCGYQVDEVLKIHTNKNALERKETVLQWFDKVKLPNPNRIYESYPFELSGGQKQRVMIAIAIACEPELLIADEPTTALDVGVQQDILKLLKDLQKDLDLSVLFISHDLGVINQLCDRVLVMRQGVKIESGPAIQIFNNPKENYTKGLIACRPNLNVRLKILPTVRDFEEDSTFKSEPIGKEEREQNHSKIFSKKPILEVHELNKFFKNGKHEAIKAVNNISLELYEGETLGLVGESGSGKTTLSRTLLLLERPTSGQIIYKGRDLTQLNKAEVRKMRRDIQIIFQDPYSSLNPKFSVKEILTEPMLVHKLFKNKKERVNRAEELLHLVDLKTEDLNKFPHEFSGGQRQRIGIARALAVEPKIIICDESVSALDVSVQAQVLNLLNRLKNEFGLTYLFISHDLSVVKFMSDRLLVMQKGQRMEYGEADAIYIKPSSVYTQSLIDAIPKF